jgi:hypothetical protein
VAHARVRCREPSASARHRNACDERPVRCSVASASRAARVDAILWQMTSWCVETCSCHWHIAVPSSLETPHGSLHERRCSEQAAAASRALAAAPRVLATECQQVRYRRLVEAEAAARDQLGAGSLSRNQGRRVVISAARCPIGEHRREWGCAGWWTGPQDVGDAKSIAAAPPIGGQKSVRPLGGDTAHGTMQRFFLLTEGFS